MLAASIYRCGGSEWAPKYEGGGNQHTFIGCGTTLFKNFFIGSTTAPAAFLSLIPEQEKRGVWYVSRVRARARVGAGAPLRGPGGWSVVGSSFFWESLDPKMQAMRPTWLVFVALALVCAGDMVVRRENTADMDQSKDAEAILDASGLNEFHRLETLACEHRDRGEHDRAAGYFQKVCYITLYPCVVIFIFR